MQGIRQARHGFTLAEILVVVAIIAIIMVMIFSLTTGVTGHVTAVRVRNEVAQMSDGLDAFKLQYGDYPPTTLVLREKGNYDLGNDPWRLEQPSVNFLKNVFPLIDLDLYTKTGGAQWHDWNGNGIAEDPVLLHGDEIMVLFLGGIPQRSPAGTGVMMRGFHTDKSNPTLKSDHRKGPFFEFRNDRLAWPYPNVEDRAYFKPAGTWRPRPVPVSAPYDPDDLQPNTYLPIYVDLYGTPYAYYHATRNEINSYCPAIIEEWPPIQPVGHHSPYFQFRQKRTVNGQDIWNPIYWNQYSFQICSAGRDRKWGFGGPWPLAQPDQLGDKDNFTNFADWKLVQGR